MASVAGWYSQQSFTDSGAALAGGRLYTYNYGTTAFKAAYTDFAATIPHTYTSDGAGGLYIALDTRGEVPSPLYLTGGSYDMALKRSDGSTVWTKRADPTTTVAELGDGSASTTGAGLVGFLYSLSYASGTIGGWIKDLSHSVGAAFIGWNQGGSTLTRTVTEKMRESVSVNDFGADPTGVNLSNAAFDLAKAQSKTLILSAGTYRLENYTIQDVRLIGARASGSNVGANEQTIIEGSGDLLVGANNFALEHLVIRNSSSGTRGKLITVSNIDTKIGPFIDVDFRRASYHLYASDATKAIVDCTFRDCRFSDANVYSRYYLANLFRYSESACYTASNKRGLYISGTSSAAIADSVFEVQDEGAIYVTNTTIASDVIRGLKFQNLHFERNGNITPTADITVNVTMSLARIDFDSCGFYSPSVVNPVELSSSPILRLSVRNCKDLTFNNRVTGSVIAWTTPKQAGLTNAFYAEGGDIGTNGIVYSFGGLWALSGISGTITGSATPTPVAMPATGTTRLVIVADSTTAGGAVLMLNNSVVTSISSTLTSITWSVVSGVLNGQTSGGASSRVLFFNFLST